MAKSTVINKSKSRDSKRPKAGKRKSEAEPAESLHHFDVGRPEFAPYGFNCEIWEPQQMQRPDRHDEIEINFLDQGTLTYLIGGERVTIQPRSVSAFWAAVPHQIVDFNNVNFYYVVTVPFGWVLQWKLPEPLMTALTHGQLVADSSTDRAKLDHFMFEQWHTDTERERDSKLEVVVLEIRARIMRLAQSAMNQTSQLVENTQSVAPQQQSNLQKAETMACFVARNYTSRIQVKDVAECVGLHPDYAATMFRKTFGTTLNMLITRHRVAHAQRKLVTDDERIVTIAQDSGFDSLSRFNRAFKQIAGTTPRDYRKSHGQFPIVT